MLDTAYVITWRYSDGSGGGATAAFSDKARAEKLVELLLANDSARQFKIEAVPFDFGTAGVPPSDGGQR
jgi:hypothetical protein